MTTEVLLREGTTAENDAFTGAAGELSYDTQTTQVRIHDGVTLGGAIIATLGDPGSWTTGSFSGLLTALDGLAVTGTGLVSGDFAVGGSVGAVSAATLYATGKGKFSTGSSGATAQGNADEIVAEGSGEAGISILTPDANQGGLYFGSPTENIGAAIKWKHSTGQAIFETNKVGATQELRADDQVTNLTLSGASGSESAVFAGTVTATDGIYLGGTGAENLLSEFEEDTYTAVMTCATSGTITLDAAKNEVAFSRVGEYVTLGGRLEVASVSSPVGAVRLSLPFTVGTGVDLSAFAIGAASLSGVTLPANAISVAPYAAAGSTVLNFIVTIDAGSWAILDSAVFGAADQIMFSIRYKVA